MQDSCSLFKNNITYTAVVLLVPLSRVLDRKQILQRVVVWREQHLHLESKATRMHLVQSFTWSSNSTALSSMKSIPESHLTQAFTLKTENKPASSYLIIRDLIKEQPGLLNLHLFGPTITNMDHLYYQNSITYFERVMVMPSSLTVLPTSAGNSNQGRKRKHSSVLKDSVSYFTLRVCSVEIAPKDTSIIKRIRNWSWWGPVKGKD